MDKKSLELMKPENDLLRSISRKGIFGLYVYVIYKIVTFFIKVYKIIQSGDELMIWDIILFAIDLTFAFLIPILSVDKPEMKKLLLTVRKALSDGKLTHDEVMAILRQTWFVVLGFWSDISQSDKPDEVKGKPDDNANIPEIIDSKIE